MEIKKGKYRHYKGGEYEVLGVAVHSEALEELVIYKMLYDSHDYKKGTVWVGSETVGVGAAERGIGDVHEGV